MVLFLDGDGGNRPRLSEIHSEEKEHTADHVARQDSHHKFPNFQPVRDWVLSMCLCLIRGRLREVGCLAEDCTACCRAVEGQPEHVLQLVYALCSLHETGDGGLGVLPLALGMMVGTVVALIDFVS